MLPPTQTDEPERIEALHRYKILDTPPEAAFDRITSLTSELLHVPIALLAFVNQKRAWIKSSVGAKLRELPREESLAGYAILQDEVITRPDAREDPHFATSPLVAGAPGVRAYACAPLKIPDGYRIGSLCAVDTVPRQFRPEELRVLEGLAAVAVDELELRLLKVAAGLRERRDPRFLWASAFDSAALGITIIGEDGRFLDLNPAYCRMTGYGREELVGHQFTDVLPPDSQDAARWAHQATMERQESGPWEWQLRRKDGSLMVVQATANRFVAEDGTPCRITTVTDTTALKRFEEELRSVEKMAAVSRLAGGAAHGFNNLLTIIAGYSQLLRSSLSRSDPLSDYVDEILTAADRATALTGKLLAFSRRRFGERERLDLNSLVAEITASIYPVLPAGVELATDLAPDLAPVMADRSDIAQAIRDLVTNAQEALPRGGRITIRTSNIELTSQGMRAPRDLEAGAYVLLAVQDNGEGFDPETRKHLFEPFYSTKGVGKGTGLAAIYGILKQIGGDVSLLSHPGKGTTVSLYLPATS
jgi:PAS domain S-box-containing protein